jgi:hypothetical protein
MFTVSFSLISEPYHDLAHICFFLKIVYHFNTDHNAFHAILFIQLKEKFEDSKAVIRSRKAKKTDNMAKRKGKIGQTTIYKTLQRKLKIEQQESH